MIKFIYKMILFFFILLLNSSLWSNQVSGLYDPPRKSVKFGRDSLHSLMPIGWSKEGNVAFLVLYREDESAELIIIDTVYDKTLYNSGVRKSDEGGLSNLWIEEQVEFSRELSQAEIIPDNNPLYGGRTFSSFTKTYSLYVETDNLGGNRGIGDMGLFIKYEGRGIKKLYSYIHDENTAETLIDFTVLGYFHSPWERRVVVISEEQYMGNGSADPPGLRFSGAHLTIGYTIEKDLDARLTGAVLSGQVYTSRALLEEGANPDIPVNGTTPLILMAAIQQNWEIVFMLWDYGANPGVADKKNRTLLHLAALSGDETAVRHLINRGLNKSFKDIDGKIPLDLALEAGNSSLSNLLRE